MGPLDVTLPPSMKTASLVWKAASRVIPFLPYMRARVIRGSSCFSLPKRKTVLVVPDRSEDGRIDLAQQTLKAVAGVYQTFAFNEGTHWDIAFTSESTPLADDLRHNNLIALAGPITNAFVRELFEDSSRRALEEVEYIGDHARSEFHWRNRRYSWSETTDFVLIAARPNPYFPPRRLILLFGLRDIGTRAASLVFADDRYKWLRKKIQKDYTSESGFTEVLLRVNHSADRRSIGHIDVATADDGEPLKKYVLAPTLPASSIETALEEVYLSQKKYPRPMRVADVHHTMIIREDFSQTIEEEVTWLADDGDVVYTSKQYQGNPPTERIEDVGFRAEVVHGVGDVVSLPASNLPQKKRFLLFLIPPIKPGQKESPRIRTSATWPRSAERLGTIGQTDDSSLRISNLHYSNPINSLRLRICFEHPKAKFRIREHFRVDGRDEKEVYGIANSYEIEMNDVLPGTDLAFTIQRVA